MHPVTEHLVFNNKTTMSSELRRAKGQQAPRDVNNDRSNLSSMIQSAISVAMEHEAHLESMQPESVDLSDSDDDLDSPSPIFDEVYNSSGNEGLITLTNFNALEFSALYDYVSDHVTTNWNVGRGKKSKFTGKDVFLLAVSVVKMGGSWDEMALPWKIKPATFQTMIVKFLKMMSRHLYEKTVQVYQELDGWMKDTLEAGKAFAHYPCAIYATDVRFQMANRPSGNHQESKLYFSRKHGLYGYKEEASVLPNGKCVHLSDHSPGSVHDLTMFKQQYNLHESLTLKRGVDHEVNDEENQQHWAILVDKGYQGSAEFCRTIHPIKKKARSNLTSEQKQINKNIASDRIIVENYFGRKVSLWGLMAHKYRWNEGDYDMYSEFCTALTNFHIHKHPLRANYDSEDYQAYLRYKQRIKDIGEDIKSNRARTQKRYTTKRRIRLEQKYHSMSSPKKTKHYSDDDRSTSSEPLIGKEN